jgi:Rad52/22 family double-strand break repair protein
MPVKPEILNDLHEPTPEGEVKQKPTFRKQNGRSVPTGKTLSYVDARYVMDRLDQVVGPENWVTRYEDTPGGVRCYLGIYVWQDQDVDEDGKIGKVGVWVTKSDVGVPSSIEAVKGTHSDAFKRAAVHWGIARDLYDDREEERETSQARPQQRSAPIREAMGELDDAADYAGDDDDHRPAPAPARRAPSQTRANSPTNGHGRANVVTAADEKNAKDMKAYRAFMQSFNEEDSPWYCPDHGTVRVNEPWITDAGKAVGGSLKCTEPWSECQQQGPWISDLVKATR